ncbi:putative dynein light chain protein [Toxoplasma gondii GT1]|uniref:Putative dynein light chain protein n=1 Tax=Toxoplasma gondii (strain ATCC 50853 / GT1) TaxID=507601 RepID=S7V130_TOXGG|nr:putative dynein light chain protein [Toxoplasma gondii GT1]
MAPIVYAVLCSDLQQSDFVAEQIQEIARHAITQCLSSVVYKKEKVNSWCAQISDACLKELAKLNKPFKYIVTCIIMQKTGASLYTAASTCWDVKTDGLCSLQVSTETMDCVVTIYTLQI